MPVSVAGVGESEDGGGLWVAFFRNMNLGQRRSRSPTSAELIGAFAAAGAEPVVNVQTNGTVIFGSTEPGRTIAAVRESLRAVTGYQDVVVVRSARWVVDLSARLGAEAHGEVSLFDAAAVPDLELPWTEPTERALTVLAVDGTHAVSCWQGELAGSNGTVLLGRLLGVPVTSRGIRTMLRLASRVESLIVEK